MLLPKSIRFTPKHGGKNRFRDKAATMKACIKHWLDGHFMDLWLEAIADPPKRGREKPTTTPRLSATIAHRALRHAQDGQYGKEAKALASLGVDMESRTSKEAMISKHPRADPPILPEDPPPAPFIISFIQAAAALRSFATGTAPGPSGMRATHLANACFSNIRFPRLNDQSPLTVLISILNLPAAWKFPEEVAPYLWSQLICSHQERWRPPPHRSR